MSATVVDAGEMVSRRCLGTGSREERKRGILETVCRPTEWRACPLGCGEQASKLVVAAYRRLQ